MFDTTTTNQPRPGPLAPASEIGAKSPSSDGQTAVDASCEPAADSGSDFEKQKAAQGEAHFRRLGWKRLTVILVVEAIGLGTFSLPSSFATLGIVAGTICCIVMGLLAIYTAWIVGKVSLAYPSVTSYGDIGGLILGRRFGEEIIGFLYVLQLILMTSSSMLTGTIAFDVLSDYRVCGVVFSIVSIILLGVLAIIPSFTEAAILGYIDLFSVVSATGITIIASGISASQASTGLSGVKWSAWPDPNATFKDGMVAICNLLFAYCFVMFLSPFMAEMHTPSDFMKSVWILGIIEIIIYILIGVLVFVFVGTDVQSPSLLSLSPLVSKVSFGLALPIIFISGSICNTVMARYVHLRLYKNSVVRYINTPKGWITWIAVLTAISIIAWVIGEGIPIFNDLLSLSSSLFISGFVLYFPAIMWFKLLCKGNWYDRQNILHALASGFTFAFGILILVAGTWATVKDIQHHFAIGEIRKPFSCST